jgi:glycosyltransferase involved in cell wall biosynthesis
MQHPKNLPSKYSNYFASEMPELLEQQNFISKLTSLKRFFYSSEIKHKLTSLIEEEKPQIAHIHGAYHHLSASTFTTLFKLNIPTVLTLHDFFPLSPSRNFIIGETLNEAAYKKTLACTRFKCIDNKLLPSLAGDLEAYYYRYKHIWDRINLFICPSQFMADKMVEWGYPREKMRVIFNPFENEKEKLPLGTNVLYLGRLHAEKGIKFLLEAAKQLPQIQFTLAGNGPLEDWVANFIQKNNLKNIQRLGWTEHGSEKYWQAIREAKVMVTPSLFYENCSISILSTLSYGRLAVATNRGGNPEIIKDGQTGFLCKSEDANDLAHVIQKAMNISPKEAQKITEQGKKLIEEKYNLENYISSLEKVYQEIVA